VPGLLRAPLPQARKIGVNPLDVVGDLATVAPRDRAELKVFLD
jgi:hypothetical protein